MPSSKEGDYFYQNEPVINVGTAPTPPPPQPDAEREVLAAVNQTRTPDRFLNGLASLLRSESYDPEDAGWVSRSLEQAASGYIELTARAERAEAERDAALAREKGLREALAEMVSHLDRCRQIERGVGGMTIEAQISRSVLLDVRAVWVEETRLALEAALASTSKMQPAAEGE